ncbi:MAG: hypothetical protein WBV93_21200 [Anaerobacillus sp.]
MRKELSKQNFFLSKSLLALSRDLEGMVDIEGNKWGIGFVDDDMALGNEWNWF